MSADPHHRAKGPQQSDTEDEDPVDRMLRKAGCLELHYKVQECMVDHRDWRKCKDQVADFKACVDKDRKRREAANEA